MGRGDVEATVAEIMERLGAQPDERGPGAGLSRFARTVGSAAGIVSGVYRGRRRAARGSLGEMDIEAFEDLVRQLGGLKGIPMKFGQMLGFLEADLPEELRRVLAILQTHSQPTPWEKVEQRLRGDLGPRADLLLPRLNRDPASTASIGQVHEAKLPTGEPVAVKVRHPGISEAIRSDFAGASVGSVFARMMVPGAGGSVGEFIDEARERLLEECDYALEAERQRVFGRIYSEDPSVRIPAVHDDFCGPGVLTTSWESGTAFERYASAASQAERDRLGRVLFEFYVGTLYRHGLFHADPHPGNYLVGDDGRLVVFDFGCVREFDAESVWAFAMLAEAMRGGDDERVREALTALGAEPPSNRKSFAYVVALLEGFFAPMLTPGPHRIDGRIVVDTREIMKSKLAVARMRIPSKLLFLFRIRFGLYSVLSRLGAVCDWSEIEQRLAEESRAPGQARAG